MMAIEELKAHQRVVKAELAGVTAEIEEIMREDEIDHGEAAVKWLLRKFKERKSEDVYTSDAIELDLRGETE